MPWRPSKLAWSNLQALFILAGALIGYLAAADADAGSRIVAALFGAFVAGGLWYAPAITRRNLRRHR